MLGQAGAAVAGAPGIWTKIAVTDSGFNQAGMLRTADGALHLVWRKHLQNGRFSFGWSTISLGGRLAGSGLALSNWPGLQGDPKLVPDHDHIRLIFIGGQDTNPSNFFSVGAVYTMVSANGRSWALVHGSLAKHTVLNLGLGAVADKDGATPVAAFGLNNVLYYHVGVDAGAPAVAADGTAATGPVATGLDGDVLSRAKNGSIWVAWFDQGYWARQILDRPVRGRRRRTPARRTARTTSRGSRSRSRPALTAACTSRTARQPRLGPAPTSTSGGWARRMSWSCQGRGAGRRARLRSPRRPAAACG